MKNGLLCYDGKNWSFSVVGSARNTGSSLGGGFSYSDRKTAQAFSLGGTVFGGQYAQNNWFVGYNRGDFSIRMTNDAWVGGDKYRTAALEVGIGEYSVGWSLFTTDPKTDGEPDKEWESPIWKANKDERYTYKSAERTYSGFYIGFKAFGRDYRAGHDGRWSQDLFQNGIHKHFVGSPYLNTSLGAPGNAFFQFYRNPNPWTLYPH